MSQPTQFYPTTHGVDRFKAGFRKGHNVCIIHPLPGPPGSTQCLFRISTTFPDKITYCPMHRTLRHILPWASPSTQLADRGPQELGPSYLKQGWDTLQAIPVVPRQCPLPTSCKSWPSGLWYHPWRLGIWEPPTRQLLLPVHGQQQPEWAPHNL